MSHIAFVIEPSSRKTAVKNEADIAKRLKTHSYIYFIAQAFLRSGHVVYVYDNMTEEIISDGIRYKPISSEPKNNHADLVVVHNGAQDLKLFSFSRAVVWQHNTTSFIKAWKRNELLSLYKFKPDIICLSKDALEKTPKWMPYSNKHLIPHAIHEDYLSAAKATTEGRQLKAFFASRPSRNLYFVIQVWQKYVYPVLPNAELVICCPPSKRKFPFDIHELKKNNIHYLGSLDQAELVNLGRSSRMLCYPGHISETGCRVALDAMGLGLPIITCGIGSLKDLVVHEKTGFIETNEKNYAKRIIDCMTNDDLWLKISKETQKHPWRQSYDQNVALWEAAFKL